jgi:MFS family permease
LIAMNKAAGRHRGLVPPLLRDRVFRRYWGASTVSMFGDQISSVAVPLTAVLVLHAGAADMGYLTAAQWLPSLLFAMHAGAWVDRRGKRRAAMIIADLGRAAALATIPVCYALHALTLVQMYLVTFAAGTLSVLFTVSDGTLFVSIVPPERYVDGQSLIYGSRSLSFMGGPSVGGLLVEALTAPYAIVADALSFLGSAFQLASIRPAEPPSSDGAGGVTAGLRFIKRAPVVRAALTGVAVINFFTLMFSALFMLYAIRDLHVRPGVVGVVLGVGAVGGMLGSVLCKRLAGRFGAGLVYVAGCLLFTAPLALVPLASATRGAAVLAMLFAAEFASGFGVMVLDISIGAIFAVVIPDTMRSRVSGAFQAINYGARPPGALLGGLLGSVLGLRQALWIAVAGGVVGALLLLPSPLPRFRMPALPHPQWANADDRSRRALLDGRPRRARGHRDPRAGERSAARRGAARSGQGTAGQHGRRGHRPAGRLACAAGRAGACGRGRGGRRQAGERPAGGRRRAAPGPARRLRDAADRLARGRGRRTGTSRPRPWLHRRADQQHAGHRRRVPRRRQVRRAARPVRTARRAAVPASGATAPGAA